VGRIPDDEVERLKREVPIEALVAEHGVTLKRHGADLVCLCIFHDEKTPSLIVSPKKNLYHCMGCGAAGSVIDWVMQAEGLSFPRACERLASMRIPNRKKSEAKTARSPIDVDAEDEALLAEVAGYYHQTLLEGEKAIAYLERRGLRSLEMIEAFKIGYADQTLQKKLPSTESKAGIEVRNRLMKLGLMLKNGREHFMASIVIPILSADGKKVLGMYGRRIGEPLSKATPVHRYLPGPHRGVFNPQAFTGDEVILCEALIDALTFWCAGFRNVSSSYGVEGFTPQILAAMKQHNTKRVFIAYDRDAAGDRAAADLAKKLFAQGIDCFRVEFPKGMDANAYAQMMKPADKSLGLVLKKARWLGEGPAPAHSFERLLLHLEATPLVPSTPIAPTPAADLISAEIASGVEAVAKAIGAPRSFVSEVMALERAMTTTSSTPPATPEHAPVEPKASTAATAELVEPASSSNVIAYPGAGNEIAAEAPNQITAGAAKRIAPETSASKEAIAPEPNPSPLAASSAPAMPPPIDVTVEMRGDAEIVLQLGDRKYRVRGLQKNLSYDLMKVNLLVAKGEHYFVDTLDLYSARQRMLFLKQGALDVGVTEDVLKKDLGHVLRKLEELQDENIKTALSPKTPEVKMTPKEEEEAFLLLKDPTLLDRVLDDFSRCGVVGEETNKLVGYLAAVSRKLEDPLAVIIQSSSAAGKSSLMEAVLAFVPEEDRIKYTAMTGQSLFYMGETNLRNKILAIVEEEGAERASYALKLLQSEKEISIASTGKDPTSGRHVTHEYRVEGPVMIFLTTTAIEIDDELLNRCVVLTVDEDRAQTQAIHRLQRSKETIEGLLRRQEREQIARLHQNAQRLLRPIYVANPFAERLTFLDSRTRMRRDHMKYLVLIRSIALLHQHQREKKTVNHLGEVIEYIEVTLKDIEVANRLAHEVLGRSLEDMPPQTKRLLHLLDEMAKSACTKQAIDRKDYRFTRKDVREAIGWGNTQLKMHLGRLESLEYIVVRSGRGERFEYELVYEGQHRAGSPFLGGLADVERLAESSPTHTIESPQDRSGSKVQVVGGWSAPGRPEKSGACRVAEIDGKENASPPLAANLRAGAKNTIQANGHERNADRLRTGSRADG
jgi:DNA primase catalytic core